MRDQLLTIAEAAERLETTPKAIRRRIDRKTLPSVLRDGRRLIPESALQTQDQGAAAAAEQEGKIVAGVPAYDLLGELMAAKLGEGLAEGKRQIEAEAHAQEIGLRQQVVQLQTRAESAEAERTDLRSELDRLIAEMAKMETILTNRQKKKLNRKESDD